MDGSVVTCDSKQGLERKIMHYTKYFQDRFSTFHRCWRDGLQEFWRECCLQLQSKHFTNYIPTGQNPYSCWYFCSLYHV